MEIEPIYSAEQIIVPEGLDDVLKVFSKEAIRKQPSDLVQFAAMYFSNKAALARSFHKVKAPAQELLRAIFLSLQGAPTAPLADVTAACRAVGINEATVTKALQAGNVNTAHEVAVPEVLLLLLSMSCDSLGAVLRSSFNVFGQQADGSGGDVQLEVPVLLQLLSFLGKRDPEVTPALREAVARMLEGHVNVTLRSLAGVPVLASKLVL